MVAPFKNLCLSNYGSRVRHFEQITFLKFTFEIHLFVASQYLQILTLDH